MKNTLAASMRALKLGAMADTYELQLENPHSPHMAFDDRLRALIEAEHVKRSIGRAGRLTRQGNVKGGDLTDLDYKAPGRSGLMPSVIRTLSSMDWVRQHHDLVIVGPTGIGKSFLAAAFAREATRAGLTVAFWRLGDLLEMWSAVAREADFAARRKRLLSPQLLVLDEWCAQPLDAEQCGALARIIEARHQVGSTLIASPVAVDDWLPRFADPTPGESIVDRFSHLKPIALRGNSLRSKFSSGAVGTAPPAGKAARTRSRE